MQGQGHAAKISPQWQMTRWCRGEVWTNEQTPLQWTEAPAQTWLGTTITTLPSGSLQKYLSTVDIVSLIQHYKCIEITASESREYGQREGEWRRKGYGQREGEWRRRGSDQRESGGGEGRAREREGITSLTSLHATVRSAAVNLRKPGSCGLSGRR